MRLYCCSSVAYKHYYSGPDYCLRADDVTGCTRYFDSVSYSSLVAPPHVSGHRLPSAILRYSSSVAFPSWSWCGWTGQFAFLVAPPEDHAKYMITWPWGPGYDVDASGDPFETGVLHIRADITSAARRGTVSVETSDDMYRTDLGSFMHLGSTQYVLVCIADRSGYGSKGPDAITTHIVLGVRQHANGIYYRESLVEIEQEVWEKLEPSTQIIRLG
jgi:hypothetical protein